MIGINQKSITFRSHSFLALIPIALFSVLAWVTWLTGVHYSPESEDIGYIAETMQWDFFHWFSNGNRFHGFEENHAPYLRPFPLVISYLYQAIAGTHLHNLVWVNYFIQLLIFAALTSLLLRKVRLSLSVSLAFSSVFILSCSAMEYLSIARFDWIQYNLSILLFIIGVYSYLSNKYVAYGVILFLALMTKPSGFWLGLFVTLHAAFSRKNGRYAWITMGCTFVYMLYRLWFSSNFDNAYVVDHTLDRFEIEGGYSSLLHNLILSVPRNIVNRDDLIIISAVLNTAIFAYLCFLGMLSSNRTIKLLARVTLIITVLSIPFVAAYWKVEIQLLVLSLLLICALNRQKAATLLFVCLCLSGGYIKSQDYIKGLNYHTSTDAKNKEFSKISELMRTVVNNGFTNIVFMRGILEANPSHIAKIANIKNIKIASMPLECNGVRRYSVLESSISYKEDAVLFSTNVELYPFKQECKSTLTLKNNQTVIFGDPRTNSIYASGRLPDKNILLRSSASGVADMSQPIPLILPGVACSQIQAINYNNLELNILIRINSENGLLRFYPLSQPCRIDVTPLKGGGITSVNILNSEYKAIYTESYNFNLLP